MKNYSKLINLIRQSETIIISGHINPEGDSLGSALALALGLKKIGKKNVCVLSRDPVPETLRFLPSSKTVRQKPVNKQYDLFIIVDCNTVERTGFKNINAKNFAVIDHHIKPSDPAGVRFHRELSAGIIDTKASATGELIFRTLKALKVPIDKNIATNLYTTILVDTGGFRYSNVSPESLRIASELVKAGARPWDIAKEVYENAPFRTMKLLGLSLSTLTRKDGIAWITTTRHMLKKTGTTSEHCEDFVDFPRKVKNAEVAVFFRQDREKIFKISLRSKGRVNVQKIAESFGGGGHAPAAGCRVEGTLKEVQEKVFAAVRKEIKSIMESGRIKWSGGKPAG